MGHNGAPNNAECIGFSRLGMVRNYKPKCQKATDHELREVVELVQEQDYSIRKAAAEKNVAFESLRCWVKKKPQSEVVLISDLY